MPSDRTTVTELGTGLGMLGLADIDEAVRSRTPGDAQPVARDVGAPRPAARRRRLRRRVPRRLGERAGLPGGRRRPAGPAAQRRGVEGNRPRPRRRGGAHRPAGRPRLPGQLQVPLEHPVQRVAVPRLRRPARRRPRAGPAGRRARCSPAAGTGTPRWRRRSTRRSTRPSDARRAESEGGRRRRGLRCAAAARRRRAAGPPPRSRSPGSAPATAPDADAGDRDGERCRRHRAAARRAAAPPRPRRRPHARRSATRSGGWLRPGWPAGAKAALRRRCRARWRGRRCGAGRPPWQTGGGTGEAMLWRLLRIGSAPYFVLGSSAARSLRLRIATSWDWRQQYRLVSVGMEPQSGGQPRVGWEAVVRDRVVQRAARGGGAHRGALEPRPFRRPPRGQGLPRHAAPPRAGVCHAPMSELRPHGTSLPRCTCPQLAWPPVVLRPFAVSDLAMVRQASADPLIPSITSVPRTYTDDAGRAFIERQHARGRPGRRVLLRDRRGGGPDDRHRVHRAVAAGDRERARLHRLLARRRRPWPQPGRPRAAGGGVVRVRGAGHPPAPPLRGAVERRLGPHGRGRPASAARPRCAAGSASTANSATPTASPSCTTEWARVGGPMQAPVGIGARQPRSADHDELRRTRRER